MDLAGPFALAQSDHQHLEHARLVGRVKVGMRLDPVDQHDAVGLVGVAVEVDRQADGVGSQDDRVHVGLDRQRPWPRPSRRSSPAAPAGRRPSRRRAIPSRPRRTACTPAPSGYRPPPWPCRRFPRSPGCRCPAHYPACRNPLANPALQDQPADPRRYLVHSRLRNQLPHTGQGREIHRGQTLARQTRERASGGIVPPRRWTSTLSRGGSPGQFEPAGPPHRTISNALRVDLRLLAQGFREPENLWPSKFKFLIVTVAPG